VHELAVCTALIDQIAEIAREHDARRVRRLVLRIGPLAGIEVDALRRAYPLASAGTRAAGADLLIEVAPVRVECLECAAEAAVPQNRLTCPSCGSWRTRVLSGDELVLVSVELDKEKPAYV
jgi:hydrogenase nickel incorporation protein HypA/HybF